MVKACKAALIPREYLNIRVHIPSDRLHGLLAEDPALHRGVSEFRFNDHLPFVQSLQQEVLLEQSPSER